MKHALALSLSVVVLSTVAGRAWAEMIVPATYDVDSYMFIGYNINAERGLTLTEDFSEGIVAPNNAHFVFSVIKFGDLGGLSTKAAGGGDKFLRLSTDTFPGPATIALSIAQADIEADDETGYPSLLFDGNRNGLNVDRLRWYMDNIKGDDPAFGGYAGGAPHIGVFDISSPGTYQLDVTAAVDAWISESQPNYGFGLWGIEVSGGQDNTFDLAALENPGGNGPALVVTGMSSEPTPGDANNDGVVDRSDLARLIANFGRTGGVGWAEGDFDGNGHVSLADAVIIQANLSPLVAAGMSPGATAVPEPSTAILLLVGVLAVAAAGRFRRVGANGLRP
jgi:hypothetical protein